MSGFLSIYRLFSLSLRFGGLPRNWTKPFPNAVDRKTFFKMFPDAATKAIDVETCQFQATPFAGSRILF